MTQPADRPDDAAIRHALESIVSSTPFSRSERLRAFVTYVVEREIEGNGHQLKGYTIGIDVFGRSHAFNADSDPLVRVHAGKLRKLLDAYYEGEGAGDDWRITIPKGSYLPIYRRLNAARRMQASDETKSGVSRPGQALRRRRLRPSWLPAPLSSPVAMLSVLPLLLFAPLTSPAMSVNLVMQPRMEISGIARGIGRDLPEIIVKTDVPERNSAGARFAAALRKAASHYTTVSTSPIAGLWQKEDAASPLSYTLLIARLADMPAVKVTILNAASTEPVYEKIVQDTDLGDEADILFESLSLANEVLAVDGAIFRHAIDTQVASSLMQCMVLTQSYRLQQSRDSFHQAKSCQDDLPGKDRSKLRFVISAGALPATLSR